MKFRLLRSWSECGIILKLICGRNCGVLMFLEFGRFGFGRLLLDAGHPECPNRHRGIGIFLGTLIWSVPFIISSIPEIVNSLE